MLSSYLHVQKVPAMIQYLNRNDFYLKKYLNRSFDLFSFAWDLELCQIHRRPLTTFICIWKKHVYMNFSFLDIATFLAHSHSIQVTLLGSFPMNLNHSCLLMINGTLAPRKLPRASLIFSRSKINLLSWNLSIRLSAAWN